MKLRKWTIKFKALGSKSDGVWYPTGKRFFTERAANDARNIMQCESRGGIGYEIFKD